MHARRRRRCLWLEHQWNESPLFDTLAGAMPRLVDGAFAVPTGRGSARAVDRARRGIASRDRAGRSANLDERLG